MESSSLQDVLGARQDADATGGTEGQGEETKQTVIDPAELNDIDAGEFRIEALRMKDAEAG